LLSAPSPSSWSVILPPIIRSAQQAFADFYGQFYGQDDAVRVTRLRGTAGTREGMRSATEVPDRGRSALPTVRSRVYGRV
jgi:hypothetical protein